MVTHKCNKCGVELPFTEDYFYKDKHSSGGLLKICISCKRIHNRKYTKIYYNKNKHKISKYTKTYRENNQDKIKLYREKNIKKISDNSKIYRNNHSEQILKYRSEHKEIKSITDKIYRDNNKEKLKILRKGYAVNRRKVDINFRITHSLRSRLNKALKGTVKSATTKELLGCDFDFLKNYLEQQFTKYMSWENYGSYWHLDHIIPCCNFDLTKEEEQKKCFNYKNLQPLEAIENIKKGGKILEEYKYKQLELVA